MIETNFKQTEIGLIPEDWDVEILESISDIKTGPFGSVLHAKDYKNSGTPIITVEHLGEPYILHSTQIPLVSDKDKERLTAYILSQGDIVYSRVGSVDRNSIVTEKEDGWLFSGRLLRVRLNSNCNSVYFSYHLNGSNSRKRIIASAVGLGMPCINTKIIGQHLVALPPINEQCAIAKSLREIDELIINLRKVIAKKRSIKSGAMSNLLSGSARLPGFTSPWEEMAIGQFADVITGATPSTEKESYWNGTIRWMNSGEINLKYVYEVENRITQEGYDSTSTHMLPKHCVLIGLAGQGKTRGTAAINLVELCTNQSIGAILPSTSHDSFFLFHLLDSKYRDLRTLSSGEGTRGGLTKKQILEFSLFLPCIEEQKAIARILTDIDDDIAALEAKLKKYEQLKQGMMQQLLTGKIRLISSNESKS